MRTQVRIISQEGNRGAHAVSATRHRDILGALLSHHCASLHPVLLGWCSSNRSSLVWHTHTQHISLHSGQALVGGILDVLPTPKSHIHLLGNVWGRSGRHWIAETPSSVQDVEDNMVQRDHTPAPVSGGGVPHLLAHSTREL